MVNSVDCQLKKQNSTTSGSIPECGVSGPMAKHGKAAD